jgi:hypothetical protein
MTSIGAKNKGTTHLKNQNISGTSHPDRTAGVRDLSRLNRHSHPGQSLNALGGSKGVRNHQLPQSNLDSQTAMQLRHWKGPKDSANQAREKNRECRRDHHDRSWWRRHCVTIISFDFGWWGWWDGWWYPCWGYDPYSYYGYDQPIYGYGGLAPDQVVANLQAALQEQGYFSYAVDGQMGPLTRAAIMNYQRDHLLPITGSIDPATLGSLGLTD